MQDEALAVVRQGSNTPDLRETRHAYMRYVGQGHEIPVALPNETCGEQHAGIFRDAFESAYTALYGRTIDGIDIEVLSWTLMISAPSDHGTTGVAQADKRPAPDPVALQSLFDPVTATRVDVPVYLRDELRPGMQVDGPALITEDQTTTVVTSRFDAHVDARANIVMTQRSRQ